MYKRLCTYVAAAAVTAVSLTPVSCASNQVKKVEKKLSTRIEALESGKASGADLEKIAAEVKDDITKLQGQYEGVKQNKKVAEELAVQIEGLQTDYAAFAAQIAAVIKERAKEKENKKNYDQGKKDGLEEARRIREMAGK